MSSHERFRLSHLMPNSWFYKLRDMKRPGARASQRNAIAAAARSSRRSSSSSSSSHHHHHYYYLHGHGTATPKPLPLSPQRSYYPYLLQPKPMQQHDRQFHIAPRAPPSQKSPAAAAGGEDDDDDDEFQYLQLRPIRTRPPALASSAESTCPSSPRLRSRRLHVLGGGRDRECNAGAASTSSGRRRRSGGGGGFAVVKASAEPARDFRESMVEMVAENGMRAPEDLLELLERYLSLNAREHHGVIMEVFRGICIEVADSDCVEV
uniref:Transcription repressor n=1 Tax=Oryza brachyantha TaxID=4533 RepID=J3M609_ORYBR